MNESSVIAEKAAAVERDPGRVTADSVSTPRMAGRIDVLWYDSLGDSLE